jgi:hypothetical protein
MPKVPTDYSNTIMYKIVCKDLNVKELYVGHTVNFRMRKCKHASDCAYEMSKNYNLKIYKYIRENGGWSNWEMIEIEKYNCNDGNEARARERYWYEQLEAKLNQCYPARGDREYSRTYYHEHKHEEEYRAKRKLMKKTEQYKAKEKIRSNKKHLCDCGGRYTTINKPVHARTIIHKTYLLNQELEKNKQEE